MTTTKASYPPIAIRLVVQAARFFYAV